MFYLWKKNLFVIAFADIERKCFGILSKTFRRNCENSILCIQRNIFTVRNFFLGKKKFVIFFGPSANVLAFCRKFIREVVKSAGFISVKYQFFRDTNSFCFSLRTLSETFFGLLMKNCRGCENCILHIHSNILMNFVVFENFLLFKHFWTFTEEHLVSSGKIFYGVETSAFYV